MKSFMKSVMKYIFLLLLGGAIYYFLEVVWRGYSHWTMFLLGGLCFVLVGLLNNVFTYDMYVGTQALCGTCIITGLELIVGEIVNKVLGWNVWDYSELPLNVDGQICIPFMCIWFILSIVIIYLDDYIRYISFDDEKPHYKYLLSNIF